MIIKEQYNNKLIRIYSDQNLIIKKVETGETYEEVIIPADSNFIYEETDEYIEELPINYEQLSEHYKTLLDTVSGETGGEE